MHLLRAEYKIEQNTPIIYLFCRENGKRVIHAINNFTPYFYVPDSETNVHDLRMKYENKLYESINGEKIRKAFTILPSDVPKLRDKFSKSFEADVLFPTRYMIDRVDSLEYTEPKIMYLDIEVDSSGHMPKLDLAMEAIICIGIYDSLERTYTSFVNRADVSVGTDSKILDGCLHEIRYFRNEIDMLRDFVEFIHNEGPDVLCGWNLVRFDLTYILNRLDRLGFDVNRLSPINSVWAKTENEIIIKGIALVDLYDAYRKMTFNYEESYKLEYISQKVVGEGKVGIDNIRWLWKMELDKLIDYNSIHGKSMIPVFSSHGALKNIKIEKLFKRYSKKKVLNGKNEIIDVSKLNLSTLAVDELGTVKIRKINKIFRHRCSTKDLLNVTLKSGKSIIVTPNHSLVIWDNNLHETKICNTISLSKDAEVVTIIDDKLSGMSNTSKKSSSSFQATQIDNPTVKGEFWNNSVLFSRNVKEAIRSTLGTQRYTRNKRQTKPIPTNVNQTKTSTSTPNLLHRLWKKITHGSASRIQEMSKLLQPMQGIPNQNKHLWKRENTSQQRQKGISRTTTKTKSGSQRSTWMDDWPNQETDAGEDGYREVQCHDTETLKFYEGRNSSTPRKVSNERCQECTVQSEGCNQTRKVNVKSDQKVYSITSQNTNTNRNEHHLGFNDISRKWTVCSNICRWLFLSLLPTTLPPTYYTNSEKKFRQRQKSKYIPNEQKDSLLTSLGMSDKGESYEHHEETSGYARRDRLQSLTPYKSRKKTTYVYDLEVDDCHTFLANNIFVHNTQDVRLVYKIDKKLGLLQFLDELRRLCFCQLEDTLVQSKCSDSYILRLFHGRKVFPTKTEHERAEFEGAMVESWAKGIYENVANFDVRSLYPSTIVVMNLSPETFVEDGDIHVNGCNITSKFKGFLPEVIENLFKERARYKQLMKTASTKEDKDMYDSRQKATKILLNALYGQTAFPHSRLYYPKIAETITFVGRSIITWSKDFLEELGYKVHYIDTDGIFFQLDEHTDPEVIRGLLNDSYPQFCAQFNVKHHIYEMEAHSIFRKIFFGQSKKRYAGSVIWKDGEQVDELEVIGFEVRRSDSSQFSRTLQKTVFDMLLRQDKPKDEVLRYIGGEIDRIRKGEYHFTEIGIPKGITRDLADYGNKITLNDMGAVTHQSSTPINVRGARYARDVLGYELSSKPKMIYVSKLPDRLPSEFEGKPVNIVCFDDDNQVPPGTQIDTEKMLEKLVKSKIESIFEALGWSLRDLDVHWKGKAPKKGVQNRMTL